MIKIFYGDDRIKATREIENLLGKTYEIIEGPDLAPTDLLNIFQGISLFADNRKILIRDLSENKPAFEKLPDYLDTKHDIILLETKLDKRSSAYKTLKSKIEIKEFSLKDPNLSLVFGIYDAAKRDGREALATLEKIKTKQDPIMFFGLLVSKALKDYAVKQGTKEKRVLKELSKLDLNLKSTSSFEPWLLIESFLLRLSSL